MNEFAQETMIDIPQDILSQKDSVMIIENYVIVGGTNVYYQEANASPSRTDVSLLLLHGSSFTSQTWRDLGTLALVASIGLRVVALDLPGFGKTSVAQLDSALDRLSFLHEFVAAMKLNGPVIVSPSMSGSYSLPYLLNDLPNVSEAPKARGFIPVAPVDTDKFTEEQFAKCTISTLLVYGSNDTGLGLESLSRLKLIPNSRVCCFRGAGHACYMNMPDLWHKVVYNFLKEL